MIRRFTRARRVAAFLAKGTAAGALLALAAAGCAPGGYYNRSQDSLDSLVTSQAELIRRIDRIEKKLETTREGVAGSRASTDARFGELSQRLGVLEGKIEESSDRFDKLSMKVDNVKQRLSSADSARVAAGLAPRDTTGRLDPEDAYQAAYSDIAAGRYTLARDAFREYLKHYPNTEVSDNAQYWIGECLYATGDFQGAIVEFKRVVDNYPKGDKVPAALFKTGVSQARLKQDDEAKKTFRLLIQRYPKSPEAALAKERLGSLQ
jgi:tol-pal system protein YbgF